MFGIGWAEMMVIGLVALIVVGPEKLPEMARTVGKLYIQLRRAATEASQAISAEVDLLGVEASKALDGVDKDLAKSIINHPSLEEIKRAVNPSAPTAENQAPAAEAAAPPENPPADQPAPLSRPESAEDEKNA